MSVVSISNSGLYVGSTSGSSSTSFFQVDESNWYKGDGTQLNELQAGAFTGFLFGAFDTNYRYFYMTGDTQPLSLSSTVPIIRILTTYCDQDYYSATGYQYSDCKPCPSDLTSNYCSQSCGCNKGYYLSNLTSLQCSECQSGYYNSNYGLTELCYPCPSGSASTGTGCDECASGYYQPSTGQSTCLACPGVLEITPTTGSTTEAACLSLLPNFVGGFVVLAICIFMYQMYLLGGRAHRIAFLRHERAIKIVNDEASNVCLKIDEHRRYALGSVDGSSDDVDVNFVEDTEGNGGWKKYLKRLYVLIFLLCAVVVIAISTAFHFVVSLTKILFVSLLALQHRIDLNVNLSAEISEVLNSVSIFSSTLERILLPFLSLVSYLSLIDINLNAINVTCAGAQAPMEMFINIMIVLIVVVFVESSLNVVQADAIQGANSQYISEALTTKNIKLPSKLTKFRTCLFCAIWVGFSALNPVVWLLQLLATLFDFGIFFQNYYIVHEWSESCNNVPHAKNLDIYLAVFSSILCIT